MANHAEDGIFAKERKNLIVEYVNKYSKATVSELCSKFSVSPATIRNDLRELDEAGLLSRTHGGAITKTGVNFEPKSNEKSVLRISAKQAIARGALRYIHEGDSIALDAGTTSFELAKLLDRFNNLTVVTYDLNIASFLEANTHVTVIIAGGQIRRGFHYTMGDMAQIAIKDLNVDIAFIAVNGISCERGLSTPKYETGSLKNLMMNNSKQVIVIADSGKINNVSFAKFADIDDVDVFVTDSGGDAAAVDEMRKKEIEVLVVEDFTD